MREGIFIFTFIFTFTVCINSMYAGIKGGYETISKPVVPKEEMLPWRVFYSQQSRGMEFLNLRPFAVPGI